MTFVSKSLATALVAVMALAATTTSASADRWLKVINRTSVILYTVRASPANMNTWGPDLLKNRQVPPGYSTTIDLNNRPKGCTYDIRAEFIDGDVVEKYGIDVCGGHELTIYP